MRFTVEAGWLLYEDGHPTHVTDWEEAYKHWKNQGSYEPVFYVMDTSTGFMPNDANDYWFDISYAQTECEGFEQRYKVGADSKPEPDLNKAIVAYLKDSYELPESEAQSVADNVESYLYNQVIPDAVVEEESRSNQENEDEPDSCEHEEPEPDKLFTNTYYFLVFDTHLVKIRYYECIMHFAELPDWKQVLNGQSHCLQLISHMYPEGYIQPIGPDVYDEKVENKEFKPEDFVTISI